MTETCVLSGFGFHGRYCIELSLIPPIFNAFYRDDCSKRVYICIMEIKKIENNKEVTLALLEQAVPAGFPSPAQDYTGDSIDLNKELIHHPSATFCARVTGRSMQDCGINDGDLLLVDKSLPPLDGSIAVCFIDGEFTLKRISIRPDGLYLMPANPAYPTLRVAEGSNFQVWGVVSYVIKDMKRG